MEIKFPPLGPEDIEVRISGKQGSDMELALYMNVRSVWKFLDAAVGAENWQSEFKSVDGKLFCAISIWDPDKGTWVRKENAGTPTDFESVKGEASDAMKRAAFVWGLGRELYTAPAILVKSPETPLFVKDVEYTGKVISKLIIMDAKGKIIFSYGRDEKPTKETKDEDVVVTSGKYKGRTLYDICRENACLLFEITKEADPSVAGAAKRLIMSNPKLKAMWEKKEGK